MIPRYIRPAMAKLWSEQSKFERWLKVELAATYALAQAGIVPMEAAVALREKATFTIDRINEIEKETRHDVLAFTTAVAENVGPEARWLHFGLTSTDVVDTAQALAFVEASAMIRAGIIRLREALKTRAVEFQHTPAIGRTHGVHAEPTTFGMKLLLWYAEMGRNLKRFDAAAEDMRVRQTFGRGRHLRPPEARARSGDPERTRPAGRFWFPRKCCSATATRPTCVRSRSFVRRSTKSQPRFATCNAPKSAKQEEFFSKGQKGSSAMPHKRNPITCEQMSGLARVVRGNAQVGLENVALWHERDISHSSAERVVLPDSTGLTDYMLDKMGTLIEKLLVYPERMMKNLELTGGLVFSGQLLLDLAAAGMSREDAYKAVQTHAMDAWENGKNFRELIAADPAITAKISPETLAKAFDYTRQLRNIDEVFARVLAEG